MRGIIVISLTLLLGLIPVWAQNDQPEETKIEPLPALTPLVRGAELPRLAVFDIYENRFDSAEQLHLRWVLVCFIQTDDSLSLKQIPSLRQLFKEFSDHLCLVLVDAGDSSVEILKRFRLMQSLENAVILQDYYKLITHEFSVESQIPTTVLADTSGIIQFVHYGPLEKGEVYSAIKNAMAPKP
ncbi:MAG: hypothetical protein V2A61_01520 [Calditrichota bacterium]